MITSTSTTPPTLTYPSTNFTEASIVPWNELPYETLVEIATGGKLFLQPNDPEIIRLFLLSEVSNSFKNKVEAYCLSYLKRAGKIEKIAKEFPTIDFETSNAESLAHARLYFVLKVRNLKNCIPAITEYSIKRNINDLAYDLACICFDPEGNPEYWSYIKVDDNYFLEQRCLKTQAITRYALPKNLMPVSNSEYSHKPHRSIEMALLDKNKIAIYCNDLNLNHKVAAIIERDPKTGLSTLCHQINTINRLINLYFKDGYLYIDCLDLNSERLLQKYNSKIWNKEPQIFIVQDLVPGKYPLCFSNNRLTITRGPHNIESFEFPENNFLSKPIHISKKTFDAYICSLKNIDDEIFALSSGESEGVNPATNLVRLDTKDSWLGRVKLLKFPLAYWSIMAF